MGVRPSILAAAGILAGVLVTLAVPVPAQAGTAVARSATSTQAGTVAAAAVSPTISPAANRVIHLPKGQQPSCPSGNFCAGVLDPTTNSVKWFFLFTCHTYGLSHWQGTGVFINNQTNPGGTAQLEDQHHGPVGDPIPVGVHGPVDWDDVWFIVNCFE